MIRSMTAFASSEVETEDLAINCELRSVNHRYCDITLKLPERFRFMEGDIRKILAQFLKRGKIECAINYKKKEQAQSYQPNLEAVKGLLAATDSIQKLMDNPQPFSALDVLAFPGIQQEPEIDKSALQQAGQELLEQALSQLLVSREREGEQLGQMLEIRCQKIFELISEAEKRMPEVLSRIRKKLADRIVEMVKDPDFDRFEQELVMLTQKLDVDEELDRLKAHTNEVLRVLKQNEPIGRRLDFLMQEMNREANTLGSKSSDKEMTRIAIDLKVLIEQMREQIQNIE